MEVIEIVEVVGPAGSHHAESDAPKLCNFARNHL
jgi:hypothetical protein